MLRRQPPSWILLFLVAAGLAARLAALPLPGTGDMWVWRIWAFNAATGDPATFYADPANPGERRLLAYDGRETTVDYPPLALYALAIVGRAHHHLDPRFENTPRLNVAIKLPILLTDAALAGLLWWLARRWLDPARARWLGLASWLNPALVWNGVVLGYLDLWMALPVVGSLAAASLGHAALAGTLLAIATLIKPQAVFIAPVMALALWRHDRARSLAVATGMGLMAGLAALGPVVAAGQATALATALGSFGRHDMLSGNAANLWWIVNWLTRAAFDHDLGWGSALTSTVRILALSTWTDELHLPDPQPVGFVLLATAVAWALWIGRSRRTLADHAALGAFIVHAYFTLALRVHENHLLLAIPLATLAAAGLRGYARLAAGLSAILALNLFLFYGISEYYAFDVPRHLTGVDTTVLVALANLVVFAWHVRLFGRLHVARDEQGRLPTPRRTSPVVRGLL